MLDGLAKNVRLSDDGRYHWHWDPKFRIGPRDLIHRHARLEACAANLMLPTLLVRGGLSDVLSEKGAQSFLATCPHTEYVKVQGAATILAGDRNDIFAIFAEAVIEFLSRAIQVGDRQQPVRHTGPHHESPIGDVIDVPSLASRGESNMEDAMNRSPSDAAESLKRVRVRHFRGAKEQGIKITGLTSYDFLSATIFDRAGIDFLLVGDSAGNAVFGYDSTLPVTIEELIPLCRAVVRGARRALVIADLPFGSYEAGPDDALHSAIRFMKETGVHAVKLEGGRRSSKQIEQIVRAGIPVMAHIGFTPQSEHGLGGHTIQGRGEGAAQLLDDAHAVEDAGAFAVVMEMVPSAVAADVTKALAIPTISVGAGPHCDGQLMVWTDWAGFTKGRIPKFVKKYAEIADTLYDAAVTYRQEVEAGEYPAPQHEYDM